MSASLVGALGVFLAVWLGLFALLRTGIAHRLAIDEPNHRSLHTMPTPRVGGLLLVPAALAGWLMTSLDLWHVAVLGGGLSLLSYADDRKDLPVGARFGAHLAGAAFAAWLILPAVPLWLLIFAVLAIAWLTNLYNFMDGADGLAGGMAVIGFGAYSVAAWWGGDAPLATATVMLAAAAGGFLMLNFPPAKVFMGDAGSIPLGFLAGALGIAGAARGNWPMWFPLLAFAPFIVDATVTLARRAVRGEKIWQAHREHAYQRMVRAGLSHRAVACRWYGVMLLGGLLALALLQFANPFMQWVCSGLWIFLLAGLSVFVARAKPS